MSLKETIAAAHAADEAFDAALQAAGIKSRWHSFGNPPPPAVAAAMAAKIAADHAMHKAFEASRAKADPPPTLQAAE